MELMQAIHGRRSVRAFTDDPVSMEDLDAILAAGCAAPSALNQQPWSFTVITDPAMIKQMEAHCVATRDKLAADSGKGWVAKYDMGFIGAAKALIIVAADPSKIGMGAFLNEEGAHAKAASACVQNMLLAITAKGLGSLWFTMYQKDRLCEWLKISPELEIVAMLPVGVVAGDVKPVPRKDHKELTTYY